MTTSEERPQPSAAKSLTIYLHAGFFLIGIITVLLGQTLPFFTGKFSLTDRQAGYFFVGQFAGSLTGTFFYNRIIRKFGYLKTLLAAFCLMAFGCFGLNFDSWFWCLGAVCFYGVGIGAAIPAINLLIIELNPEKSSSALNIINFFWGAGAILCKPFVDFVGSSANILLPTALLGISLLLIGLTIGLSNCQPNFIKEESVNAAPPIPVWTTLTAWLIAAFNFIHIGIESSVGGWITTYELRLTELTADRWLSAALAFFLFLVIGRGIAPIFFRFLRENTVMFGSLIVMTAGIILILQARDFLLLTVGAAILGFGSSSVFPANMSRFTKIFGAQATRKATPLFVCGSLGGAFATWFIGFASTTFGNLRLGFSAVLVGCLSLLVLQIILTNTAPK